MYTTPQPSYITIIHALTRLTISWEISVIKQKQPREQLTKKLVFSNHNLRQWERTFCSFERTCAAVMSIKIICVLRYLLKTDNQNKL